MSLFSALKSLSSIALLGALLFAAPTARAADPIEMRCPAPAGASSSLAATDASARFHFIRTTLAEQAKRATLWSGAWSFFGGAVAAESVVLAATSNDEKQRIIWLANGLPALGFPGLVLIDPIKVMADDRKPDAVGKNDPRETKLCANLARAEQMFADDAADEKKKNGVFSHVLCVLANLASSAVIVIGTGEWGSAITNFVGGEAVSELNLYSLPTGAVSANDRYRAGDLSSAANAQVIAHGLSFSISF